MKRFLVVLRYDDEDFSINPRSGMPVLYSRRLRPYDQIPLFERMACVLERHGARASFAVSYALLKRGIEHLEPFRADGSAHLFTWHLHLRWDPSIGRDLGGRSTPSCYLGYYRGTALKRLLDLADGAFEDAFGYVPTVNLNACFSTSTELLRMLERRGYLVQGDYTPNTDYRVMERLMKYKFDGARRFQGGPGASCYPYAPDCPYRPNRNAGMLMGDMNIVVVPINQLSPGVGIPHQETYQDPEFEIKAIDAYYQSGPELSVLILAMHPHALMFGSGSAEENVVTNLRSLDKVLHHVEQLEGMEYANYLDVRSRFLETERALTDRPRIQDAGNGYLISDGSHSIKCQSVGVGEHFEYEDPVMGDEPVSAPSIAIGQDNGVAEWLVHGRAAIGPKTAPKIEDRTYRRGALVTTDVVLDGRRLRLPQQNLEATAVCSGGVAGFSTRYRSDGVTIESRYLFDLGRDLLTVETNLTGERCHEAIVEHRYGINAECSIVSREDDAVVFILRGMTFSLSSPRGFVQLSLNDECHEAVARMPCGTACATRLQVMPGRVGVRT